MIRYLKLLSAGRVTSLQLVAQTKKLQLAKNQVAPAA